MKIVEKLKGDKKLLLIILIFVIVTFVIPYITIPGIILWWFYKKSRFSKKAKVITTTIVGGLFALLTIFSVIAYSKDTQPHLNIVEPSSSALVQGQKVIIKGTYDPVDRKVWINGKDIGASGGKFEYVYQLKEGENKIEVNVGNWKRARVYLTVTRELTEEEKAAKITPTPTLKSTSTPTPIASTVSTTPKVSILPSHTPKTLQQSDLYIVSSVVDGDTIKVVRGSEQETLRLIGIDTPETIDPRKPVQCFGKEASAKAKSLLSGKSVRLEADPTQGERDKYQRLLRYVFLEDGTSFNKLMISEGYAYEYTYNTPYKYQSEYKQAQKEAEINKRGLWADNACSTALQVATPTKTIVITSGVSNTNTNGGFNCAGKTLCGQMTSCAEAKFYLNTCGISRLDGDKDGVPCESLCN